MSWTDEYEKRPMRPCRDCGTTTNNRDGWCDKCLANYEPEKPATPKGGNDGNT